MGVSDPIGQIQGRYVPTVCRGAVERCCNRLVNGLGGERARAAGPPEQGPRTPAGDPERGFFSPPPDRSLYIRREPRDQHPRPCLATTRVNLPVWQQANSSRVKPACWSRTPGQEGKKRRINALPDHGWHGRHREHLAMLHLQRGAARAAGQPEPGSPAADAAYSARLESSKPRATAAVSLTRMPILGWDG